MRTEIYTYQTVPDGKTKLLYSAEGLVRVSLQLINAGPVAIGQRQDIAPVLSGKGITLSPGDGEPFSTVLTKDNRLFIVAESINQVKFIVEPIPYLEQILYQVEQGFGAIEKVQKATLGIFGKAKRAAQKKAGQ
jgi:hypothetical protein